MLSERIGYEGLVADIDYYRFLYCGEGLPTAPQVADLLDGVPDRGVLTNTEVRTLEKALWSPDLAVALAPNLKTQIAVGARTHVMARLIRVAVRRFEVNGDREAAAALIAALSLAHALAVLVKVAGQSPDFAGLLADVTGAVPGLFDERGRGAWRSTRCCPTPPRSPTGSVCEARQPASRRGPPTGPERDPRHRGRRGDPLHRTRRLRTTADERLDDHGRNKLLGLLEAGDPRGEVRTAWHPKETVRSIYDIGDPDLAAEFVRLGHDLQDDSCPPEVRQLGRTIVRWREQFTAWHRSRVSNGPTEAINNLIERVKRVAFGFRRFAHYRIRALPYAARPNWDPLPTITHR